MVAVAAPRPFFAPPVSKVYYAATLANFPAVAAADLEAAQDITAHVADVSGWTVKSNMIDVPGFGSRFTAQIPGRISADASSITFKADKEGRDIREILVRDDEGFIIFDDAGTGLLGDVFPIQVTAVGKVRGTGDNEFRLTVDFAITSEPAEDVALPGAGGSGAGG